MKPEILLERLNAIGHSLSQTKQCYALLALGSVGLETDRLDEFSDLDFFVIAKEGSKQRFINELDWLSDISEIGYKFKNTDDGYKVLYADGVFCEFAVFEPSELNKIQFSAGRVVWQETDFNPSVCSPSDSMSSSPQPNPDMNWQIGEALTNLYVGMNRDRRGETLSAMRFIQSYALDRLIEISIMHNKSTSVTADPFMSDRRIEARFPEFAEKLPSFAQGYNCNSASALAQLRYLETHFDVNRAMATAIKELCS